MTTLSLTLIAGLLLAGVACTAAQPLADVLAGDFNQNGRLDFADIVGLFNYLGGNAPYLPHMDLNQNGRLDFADVVAIWGRL